MSLNIRAANLSDIDTMVDLLIQDADQRSRENPNLWALDTNPREKIATTIKTAMTHENPPFRQHWLLAESADKPVGITHSILLPVPPIYAGDFGAPGLIMEDCFVAEDAPASTLKALLKAAETDLIEAGAKVLVASSVAGGAWALEYAKQDYEPLTLYLAKSNLNEASGFEGIRRHSKGHRR